METSPAKPLWPTWVSTLVVLCALALCYNIYRLPHLMGVRLPAQPFHGFYGIVFNLIAVAIALAGAWAISRGRPFRRALGLFWAGWRAPLLVLASTTPFWVGVAISTKPADHIDFLSVLLLAFLFPLAEETIFRGFGFLFARSVLGWNLGAALIIQGFIVGAVHVVGNWDAVHGIAFDEFLITGLGAVVMAGLDELGDRTLWPGYAFHVSLNLAWNLFDVSDTHTAVSGWFATVLRIVVAVLTLVVLRRFGRRTGSVAFRPETSDAPL